MLTPAESGALGIYVVMARDWSDALEMIEECEDGAVLDHLLQMLEAPPTPQTDGDLNALFAPVVRDRAAKVCSTRYPPDAAAPQG